ncbi:MAG: hypothetical protein RBS78_05900 [Coriobacteriia bacterium]|jgi:Tfp pilus assembly protein PilN|nr:hypothetical protein [Coriobacteriia bacterium]
MNTLQINLLPPEVLERRRLEKWYKFIFLGFFVLLVLALLLAAWLLIMAQGRQDRLQALKDQSRQYQTKAEMFAIFEQRQNELDERQTIVDAALAGRVNMGRLAYDVSLIMPDEVWLEHLAINQEDGLALDGFTPLSSSQAADVNYKSIARTLVRLDSLADLDAVWLGAASAAEYDGWQIENPAASEAPTTTAPVLRFSMSGRVKSDNPPVAIAGEGPRPIGGAD